MAAGEDPSSDFFRDFKLPALIPSNHNISNDPLNEVYVQFEYKDKENDILSCVVFLARDMRNCFHNLMIALNFSDRWCTVTIIIIPQTMVQYKAYPLDPNAASTSSSPSWMWSRLTSLKFTMD